MGGQSNGRRRSSNDSSQITQEQISVDAEKNKKTNNVASRRGGGGGCETRNQVHEREKATGPGVGDAGSFVPRAWRRPGWRETAVASLVDS